MDARDDVSDERPSTLSHGKTEKTVLQERRLTVLTNEIDFVLGGSGARARPICPHQSIATRETATAFRFEGQLLRRQGAGRLNTRH